MSDAEQNSLLQEWSDTGREVVAIAADRITTLEAERDTALAEVEKLKADPNRPFPLMVTRRSVNTDQRVTCPWWAAEIAYGGYTSDCGGSQSLQRISERGGFGNGEMDTFFPGWREKIDINLTLQAEVERLRAEVERSYPCPPTEREELKAEIQFMEEAAEAQKAEVEALRQQNEAIAKISWIDVGMVWTRENRLGPHMSLEKLHKLSKAIVKTLTVARGATDS